MSAESGITGLGVTGSDTDVDHLLGQAAKWVLHWEGSVPHLYKPAGEGSGVEIGARHKVRTLLQFQCLPLCWVESCEADFDLLPPVDQLEGWAACSTWRENCGTYSKRAWEWVAKQEAGKSRGWYWQPPNRVYMERFHIERLLVADLASIWVRLGLAKESYKYTDRPIHAHPEPVLIALLDMAWEFGPEWLCMDAPIDFWDAMDSRLYEDAAIKFLPIRRVPKRHRWTIDLLKAGAEQVP